MKKDIILSGVGGQGILSIATVIGKAALDAGLSIKQAEVHGMSQRGGDVQSNLRIASGEIASDLIARGVADIIISLEPLEALRYLHFLKKDGVVIVNDWRIDPITVVTGVAAYPEDVIETLKEKRRAIVVEATAESKKLGAPKAFNIIVLGAAARHMGFEKEDWLRVIETTVPPKTIEVNKQAFEIGYALSL